MVVNDFKINIVVVYVVGGWVVEVLFFMEIFKVYFCFGFEIVYNVVCVFVEKGEFVKVEEFFMMVYCIG